MARQKGLIKLKGTMGDITFYRTKDGYMAREKTSMTGDRLRNDPAFQRTRENMAEFGRAGQAGKYLRRSFQKMLRNVSDKRMVGRLTREMVKVIQLDKVNPRGLRNVIDGEAELLLGFEFNTGAALETILQVPFTGTIDRVAGEGTIQIPVFHPGDSITPPSGTTHFKIISGATDINFETGEFQSTMLETPFFPLDEELSEAVLLENALPAASPNPLFLLLGITFFQETNGAYSPLKNGAYNALQIVKVSGTP